DPMHARPLPPALDPAWLDGSPSVSFADGSDRTVVTFSREPRHHGGDAYWDVELGPRERWELVLEVILQPAAAGGRGGTPAFGDELTRVRDSLAAWHLRVPQLRTTWGALSQTYDRSVSDLAALRMRADG